MTQTTATKSVSEMDRIEKAIRRNGSYEFDSNDKAKKIARAMTGRGLACRVSSRGAGLPTTLVVAK